MQISLSISFFMSVPGLLYFMIYVLCDLGRGNIKRTKALISLVADWAEKSCGNLRDDLILIFFRPMGIFEMRILFLLNQ